jgi:hypothetical protein
MRMLRFVLSAAMLGLAWSETILADQGDRATTLSVSSKESVTPDYSQKALLEIFKGIEVGEKGGIRSPLPGGIVLVETRRFHLRFMPYIAPMVLLAAWNPSARFTPGGSLTMNPFALTQTTFAYTSVTYRDPFNEWQFRRFLRRNERAARRARGEK